VARQANRRSRGTCANLFCLNKQFMRHNTPFFFAFSLLLGGAALLPGCGGGSTGPGLPATPTPSPTPRATPGPTPQVTPSPTATLQLRTVTDSWPKAAPRWRDIGNNLYSSAFRAGFSYAAARVELSYQRAPDTAYFVGHLSASGLKPNFAYQLKLAGKPVGGPQGWGTAASFIEASSNLASATPILHLISDTPVGGDDWTNQQLGYANRWWDDTLAPSTNINDAYFRANYPAHTVYGYQFLGDLVTDSRGNAEADVRGDRSLHITWQDGQSGAKDVSLQTFALAASPSVYGYDAPLQTTTQKLWYELEAGRTQPVRLPRGTYHCRLLVTEEAFHTAGGDGGGVWQTVLATEDVGDQNAANDIVFSIG
jgi:hypothetical protein